MKTQTVLNQMISRRSVISVAFVIAVTGSALAFTHKSEAGNDPKAAPVKLPLDESVISRAEVPRGSFAMVVRTVAPSVVKIETTSSISDVGAKTWSWPEDPFWRRFFGDQSGQMFPPHSLRPFREHGLGSGVIVTRDGYILTNNHVVDHAKEAKVTLQDGREFTAKVIGRDAQSDIAVIKIDAKDLPCIMIADSDKVQVGDVALAVGNPFGVGQTVTKGIVSAIGRGNMGIEDYEDFIQTDAAINPGNSGGALVDIEGRLIGINTAMMSRSGGSQGVGFAIPSDMARSVMESLVKYGHVTRGYLGVMIQEVTPALAKEFKLNGSAGALVGDVVPNGPAAKAGLKDGDVILEFNGKKVGDSRHLRLEVADTSPGTTVSLKIWRDAAAQTMDVTLKQLPGNEQLSQSNAGGAQDNGTFNGVNVGEVDQQTRREFNLPENIKGAVVTSVAPDSAAAEAGLKPGDVIEEINRHSVKSPDDAVRLTASAKDKHSLLRVWSDGGSHYVVVDESKQAG